MHLSAFLSSLLSVAAIASAVVIPNLLDIQQDQNNLARPQTSVPSTFAEIHSTCPPFQPNGKTLSYDEMKWSIRGKYCHEKLIALCEAGFVTGCQQAIEGGNTARPGGKAP
ncbi:hypothetical protein N7530_012572 [Penicillium desertorum]|jgi:hypothetical protein|uniref:Uncharacterized protein n=1 Tax=Penicillium desertorum TaxID=1303715 RepID=A0A9W9WG35_9EURO|nr:hypothetical protein N7530_012572 [Penicillium desertorum]